MYSRRELREKRPGNVSISSYAHGVSAGVFRHGQEHGQWLLRRLALIYYSTESIGTAGLPILSLPSPRASRTYTSRSRDDVTLNPPPPSSQTTSPRPRGKHIGTLLNSCLIRRNNGDGAPPLDERVSLPFAVSNYWKR